MSFDSDTVVAAIEAARSQTLLHVNEVFDELLAKFVEAPSGGQHVYKSPTPADGLDPRNKNGVNLTKRGIEILYRAFDEGAGYNRSAKLLNISQGAAKNRKAQWQALGGANRNKMLLDIDTQD